MEVPMLMKIRDRSGNPAFIKRENLCGSGWLCAVLISLVFTGASYTRACAIQQSSKAVYDSYNSQSSELPVYLRDRGTGIPVSMFGTYVRRGELRFYPYFEYYHDKNAEYAPDEFGYADTNDYFGNYIAREWLFWFGYGITDRLAVEFETAYYIDATLDKASDDPSGMPTKIDESGLGDVEGQIRWRWTTENEKRPEIFSFYETVFPFQKDKQLIGTSVWELKLGTGFVKGFRWGTVTARAAIEYADDGLELGEMAVEYLKRLSSKLRIFASVEGAQDEIELITEAQWRLTSNMFVKFNSAFGITTKATDWAPEIGVMFSIPPR